MRSVFEIACPVHCWAAALALLRQCPWGLFFCLASLPWIYVSVFLGASLRVGITSRWAHPCFGAHLGYGLKSVACGCRTEVPVCLLAVSQGWSWSLMVTCI